MEERFKTVAPGVMVGKKITISIPHPDPCWIIASAKGSKIVMVSGNQSELLVFSSQKNAEELMVGENYKGYSIEKFSWDDLVDAFGTRFNSVLVDKKRKLAFMIVFRFKKESEKQTPYSRGFLFYDLSFLIIFPLNHSLIRRAGARVVIRVMR